METRLKKLPVGIQTFEKIYENDCIYVDKTRFLVDLIDHGSIYFLARPRRFGKSLTISTLDAMFSGKKELFKGLYAEEFMNRPDYQASPVIRLDMSQVITDSGLDYIKPSLVKIMVDTAKRHKMTADETRHPAEILKTLIVDLAEKYGKVVVLIDEYDKPYTDFYTDPQMAKDIRAILRNFYVQIKSNDEYIRFVFITGIAKFARFGVFSTLNNITDLSMDKKYGEMCGLTEAEIEKYFPEHIEATAAEMKIAPKELLEQMRNYYDGFSFDGIHRLYNPFSTLCFFDQKKFKNFWVKSGTSKMIADYLKSRNLTVEQFRNFPVSEDFLDEPGDMDTTPPEGFLYQGGYLTVRNVIESNYELDYPNTEVLHAMSTLLAQNFAGARYNDYRMLLIKSLSDMNAEKFTEALNSLLASIPYDDFVNAGKMNIIINDYKFQSQEWLYRSTILAFLRGCGVATVAEMHTNLGRADLVVSYRGKTFVVELKVAYQTEDVPAKLAEAITQIKEKNYLAPYPEATGLAMVIDDTERQITAVETVN